MLSRTVLFSALICSLQLAASPQTASAAGDYEGKANGNDDILTGRTYGHIYGGYNSEDTFSVMGGPGSSSIEASNNKLTLENVTASGDVCGGRAEFTGPDRYDNFEQVPDKYRLYSSSTGSPWWGAKGNATSQGNTLVIKGGSYAGCIYGGYAVGYHHSSYANASSSGNTVQLYAYNGTNPKFDADNTVIFGSYAKVDDYANCNFNTGQACFMKSGWRDSSDTDNTLEIHGIKGLTVANIKNFDKFVFELPDEMHANDVVLKMTGNNYTTYSDGMMGSTWTEQDKTTTIYNATISVTKVGNLKGADNGVFKVGDVIYLLKNDNGGIELEGSNTASLKSTTITGRTGISLKYDLEVQTETKKDGSGNEKITAIVLKRTGPEEETIQDTTQKTTQETTQEATSGTVTDTTLKKHSASPVTPETKAIAEGAIAGLALVNESANAGIELARNFSMQPGSIAPFIHVQGSSVTHETGSSVHLNAVSLIAGIGTGLDTGAGKLSAGAFFEYGKGSYTTSNSFDNASDVNGDGDAWYMGGGILAKMDFIPTGPGHFYVEGSAHMGQLHNEYDSKDLQDAGGRIAKFDLDSPYYALHGGLGYVWDITDGHELDVYGNYIWTRVQGTDETLTTGDKFEFDDMDSSRVRFGARYTYKGHERFKPYIGVAYEHEFAGSCESTTFGYNVAAPSFEGDTGMGELGLTMTPSKNLPLSFNLGVQGYVGQKRGISGNCMLKYEF